MRHVNGVYTQVFKRRHALSGHLLQGRYKAILVDRDTYLLELCRYVELNPVRARMVAAPQDWPWSSYLAHRLHAPTPPWLDCDGLHSHLLGTSVQSSADRQRAARLYAELVASAPGLDLWSQGLRKQIYLGDDAYRSSAQTMSAIAAQHGMSVSRVSRIIRAQEGKEAKGKA